MKLRKIDWSTLCDSYNFPGIDPALLKGFGPTPRTVKAAFTSKMGFFDISLDVRRDSRAIDPEKPFHWSVNIPRMEYDSEVEEAIADGFTATIEDGKQAAENALAAILLDFFEPST